MSALRPCSHSLGGSRLRWRRPSYPKQTEHILFFPPFSFLLLLLLLLFPSRFDLCHSWLFLLSRFFPASFVCALISLTPFSVFCSTFSLGLDFGRDTFKKPVGRLVGRLSRFYEELPLLLGGQIMIGRTAKTSCERPSNSWHVFNIVKPKVGQA